MTDLDRYWAAELEQAQETYRFFLQSALNLLYYSYASLFGVYALWISQLGQLYVLTPGWAAVAFVVMSLTLSAVSFVFVLASTVGSNWANAVDNHQLRWKMAAIELAGRDSWAKTESFMTNWSPPPGIAHYSTFARSWLATAGLAISYAGTLAVPALALSVLPETHDLAVLYLVSASPALAVTFLVAAIVLPRAYKKWDGLSRLGDRGWGPINVRRAAQFVTWVLVYVALVRLSPILVQAITRLTV